MHVVFLTPTHLGKFAPGEVAKEEDVYCLPDRGGREVYRKLLTGVQ